MAKIWQSSNSVSRCKQGCKQNHETERDSAETDLVDIFHQRHPNWPCPATHNRGRKTIDICFALPVFIPAIQGTTLLPFGLPEILSGDHRMLIIDLDISTLFGNHNNVNQPTYTRGVNSQAQPMITKFCRTALKACDRKQISECIKELETKIQFNADNHTQMDEINQDLTTCLIRADQKCCKHNENPWSPMLHTAYIKHRYWSVQLTVYRTERPHTQALQNLSKYLPMEAVTFQPGETVSTRL